MTIKVVSILKKMYIILILASLIFTSCSKESSILSPEDIINRAIEANKEKISYYAESKNTIYSGDDIDDEQYIKQWVDFTDGTEKVRVETTATSGFEQIGTSNGEKFVRYDKEYNQADISHLREISNFKESASYLLSITYKNQAVSYLEILSKAIEIENLGKEEIKGLETYHLKGKVKNDKEIIAELEIWIEEDTWNVAEIVYNPMKGNKIKSEIIKLDNSAQDDEKLFTQELADDVEIRDLDEYIVKQEIIPMEKAVEKTGKQLLYISEELGYKLEIREYIHYFKGEIDKELLIQEYSKEGISSFNIFVSEYKDDFFKDNIKENARDIEIRGSKGYIMDDTSQILFQEEGIQYLLGIEDKELSIEELIDIINKMITYK